MHSNSAVIQSFYESFQNLDAKGMAECYHHEIHFSDPAFPSLKGKEAAAMWAMLITNLKKSKDGWLLEFKNITADEHSGSCRWEAHYTLSSTGRKVHNIIDAEFQFKDGLIIKHTDSFEFYRWAKMGFGFTGWLLGWTSFFQKKVQARVSGLLKSFMERS